MNWIYRVNAIPIKIEAFFSFIDIDFSFIDIDKLMLQFIRNRIANTIPKKNNTGGLTLWISRLTLKLL